MHRICKWFSLVVLEWFCNGLNTKILVGFEVFIFRFSFLMEIVFSLKFCLKLNEIPHQHESHVPIIRPKRSLQKGSSRLELNGHEKSGEIGQDLGCGWRFLKLCEVGSSGNWERRLERLWGINISWYLRWLQNLRLVEWSFNSHLGSQLACGAESCSQKTLTALQLPCMPSLHLGLHVLLLQR